MCSCISRFKRLAFVASAALCCSFEGVGCAPAGVSPAACDGYAVLPSDDLSREDLRWSEYLCDHLRRRADGGERTVRREDGGKLFILTVAVDTLLRADFSVERGRRGVRLTARDGRRMLWLQYQLMKSLADEDPRIEASDLPPATVGLRDTSGRFAFGFRGLYTPAAHDADRAGILASDDAETGWGLWGHQLGRVLAGGPEAVYALGSGFTAWSKLLVNGEAVETQLVNEYLLKAPGLQIDPEDTIAVAQVCENLTILGETVLRQD